MNVPHEFWVAKAALVNPSISSSVALKNEFVEGDGVRCYDAELVDLDRRFKELFHKTEIDILNSRVRLAERHAKGMFWCLLVIAALQIVVGILNAN